MSDNSLVIWICSVYKDVVHQLLESVIGLNKWNWKYQRNGKGKIQLVPDLKEKEN